MEFSVWAITLRNSIHFGNCAIWIINPNSVEIAKIIDDNCNVMFCDRPTIKVKLQATKTLMQLSQRIIILSDSDCLI